MNATLSRRAARACNAFGLFPVNIDRLEFAYAVERADSFEDLPAVFRNAILSTETETEPETILAHGNHDQKSHGNWANGYDYPSDPEAIEDIEKHYGRREMAPSMGGVQWAFNGQSPPITEAAEDVLQGYPYDPYDRYSSYDRSQYEAADTILSTIQNESSDVTLYSGHRRDREYVEAIQREGVSFPLVATTPSKDLADEYADAKRDNPGQTVAVIYEFPPGSQAGFYRFNEHIATGEYEVESVSWFDEGVVDIKLRQTKRHTVPEKIELEEED